ncbi:hypothetical protein RN001_003290 [Aquatica leii]|uniref:Sphingomyelin phosphodiesterase n=1 Tax=Aquatica leii TaxID=1421715 RepID=A0AAN7PI41_9COLE|nr:hypothetical protein RN001_003290 [Aquatica leii]
MTWYLVFLLFNYVYIECTPIKLNFVDDWNPRIDSNKNAILNTEIKLHKLPLPSQRQEKDDDLNPIHEFEEIEKWDNFTNYLGTSLRSVFPCTMCKLAVGLLQTAVKNNEPVELIKAKFVTTCVGFEIQNEIVCNGIFDVFSPDVLTALKMTKLGPREICGMFETEVCDDTVTEEHQWEINIPPLPPHKRKRTNPEPHKPSLKVLQISDTHLDLEYAEGSNANCDEPLCCRNYSSIRKKNGVFLPAGKWGMYNCDSPKVLIENMLQNIAKQHPDIDYIIWTGDLPPHDVWQQTKNGSLENLVESMTLLKNAFPQAIVLPCVGNHEGIPAGNFPPPWNNNKNYSIDWLYNELNKQWKQWLPASESNSILHGGFYSVLVRPGFRIISINTNYCHTYSWWLYVNSTDPAKELHWLIDQLLQAEHNKEKVHIIGHIPPGSEDCLKVWSRNYYEIVNRFFHIITAQFFGHSHADEFEVFYNPKNYSQPINVAYVAPSVTPFSGQNPAFRIYYVDGNHKNCTWEIVDHETWTMDLDNANSQLEKPPEWYMLYSARNAYDMPNLAPMEWNKLIYKMLRDDKLFNQYYKFYHRNSPFYRHYKNAQKLQMLCDLKSGKSQVRRDMCHDLEVLIRI